MNDHLTQKNIKVLIFCLVVINLQTALLSSFVALPFNLCFVSILVMAPLLSTYENIVAATILCIGSSLLVYDHHIFWLYPVIALIANKINPPQIADKLLICIIYNLLFTPLIALTHLSTNYVGQILTATLTNLICSIPLFFIMKFFFSHNSRTLYVKTR